MKKYFVIYHSTKKIECITILWWVLVLLFVHLTSKLANIFSCTFYHAFAQKASKKKQEGLVSNYFPNLYNTFNTS
jgi:predicted membrane protein